MKEEEPPVVVEQDFNRSVADVWKAITDVDEMRCWYFENIPEFSAEIGFSTQFAVESGGRSFLHQWTVTEVVPQSKVVYNWHYEEYPGDANVCFELSGNENAARLEVSLEVLENFPDDIPEFSRESCLGGWTYFINERLKEYLSE